MKHLPNEPFGGERLSAVVKSEEHQIDPDPRVTLFRGSSGSHWPTAVRGLWSPTLETAAVDGGGRKDKPKDIYFPKNVRGKNFKISARAAMGRIRADPARSTCGPTTNYRIHM